MFQDMCNHYLGGIEKKLLKVGYRIVLAFFSDLHWSLSGRIYRIRVIDVLIYSISVVSTEQKETCLIFCYGYNIDNN